MGFEPTTTCLEGKCSTTELRPQIISIAVGEGYCSTAKTTPGKHNAEYVRLAW